MSQNQQRSTVVVAGEVIEEQVDVNGTPLRLGDGIDQVIHQGKIQLIATKLGIVRRKEGPKYTKIWLDTVQKRYVAAIDHMVIGIIVDKHGEEYIVDIGTASNARLPALAFEGASRRNRPNIAIGALVYARVSVANKDIDSELSCQSPHLKKDWVTGEAVYGELSGGYMFECSSRLVRRLLDPNSVVLSCIGIDHQIAFEIAVGMNGRVWVKAGTPVETIMITNAIINSERMNTPTIKAMVEQLVSFLGR